MKIYLNFLRLMLDFAFTNYNCPCLAFQQDTQDEIIFD